MHKDHYDLITNPNRMDFEFESIGPRGKIKKEVRFTPRKAGGIIYYNLGFGDLNERTGELDDLSISNNNDREKILVTVAASVLEFTSHIPNVRVYAKGSTPARTRLYQMALTSNIEEISMTLSVYGFRNGQWHSFEKNTNYEAFMVVRK